jgi:Fe-S cluster biogenesis protein NfuA
MLSPTLADSLALFVGSKLPVCIGNSAGDQPSHHFCTAGVYRRRGTSNSARWHSRRTSVRRPPRACEEFGPRKTGGSLRDSSKIDSSHIYNVAARDTARDLFELEPFMQNLREICEVFEGSIAATLERNLMLTPSIVLIRRLHHKAILNFSEPRVLVPTAVAEQAAPSDFVQVPAVYAVLDGPSWRYGEPSYEEESLQDIPIDPSKIKRVPLEPNERRLYPFADYVLQYGEKRVPVRSAPMGRIDQKRLRRNRVSVQYIGTSPNVALSVRHHLQRFGPDTCQFVRVCVFPSMDVANMEALKQAWIAEIGYTPRGNRTQDPALATYVQQWQAAHEWLNGVHQCSSEPTPPRSEPAAQQADETNDEAQAPTIPSRSNNVGTGTYPMPPAEASANTNSLPSSAAEAAAYSGTEDEQRVVSPFRNESVQAGVCNGPDTRLPLSVTTVEAALSEVRPLLQKDGGDVQVVSVDPENATVRLQFLGACASCPALEDTVRFGVEIALRKYFGEERVRNIELVPVTESTLWEQNNKKLLESCEVVLDELRPSLFAQEAVFELERVERGVLYLRYSSSDDVLYQISRIISERVRGILRIDARPFDDHE